MGNPLTALTIGLVGNPNSGKTTLFNALTGSHQQVGNWPGVTVERKSGFFHCQDTTVTVVDLPGTYSLITADTGALDERIACEFILNQQADVIVNILDANNLERNLYLTMQLLEMQVPLIIAVNMMDVAQQRGQTILLRELEQRLGCPVIPLQAHKKQGVPALKQAIMKKIKNLVSSATTLSYAPAIETAMADISQHLTDFPGNKHWLAMRLLEDDIFARQLVSKDILPYIQQQQNHLRAVLSEDPDILLADARYRFIQDIIQQVLQKASVTAITWTERIDRIVLNRVLGIPIFLAIMYGMFLFAINVGGAFQDFFDISSDTIFVSGFAHGLTALQVPSWLTALLANGVGKGINTVLTFIPVIGAMFIFLAILEDSGYMARAAFVVDRVMRAMGLPGKSFVPMIVGFGCNVPAIMATRTLENSRDRILTVMMSPFMSCGARLAIYAVFTAAFFPVGGQNVVFSLYMIGIGMAMLTGLMLRKTLLKGPISPLIMELPPYHLPRGKTIFLHAWQRLKSFVFRAGKLIVPICVLIGMLNTLNIDGTLNTGEGDAHSLLSIVGKQVTPIFAPLGIHQDNWPATVGLVTGVLAKEVVIGTLNTLYSQVGQLPAAPTEAFHFWSGISAAFVSIPTNLLGLGGSLLNPVLATAPVHTVTQDVYGIMYQRFDGQAGAFAYLLFILLYLPCVSTIAAIARELSRSWAVFSMIWITSVAYGAAVLFYQIATYRQHPAASASWIGGIFAVVMIVIVGARYYAEREESVIPA